MAKIMALAGLLFVAGIFFAGLLQNNEAEKTAVIELSAISAGSAAYFKPGRRRIIVINTGEEGPPQRKFYVAYAEDTLYGCDLQLDPEAGVLKAQCADVHYDLRGRLLKGSRNHENLRSPAYRWLDSHRLLIQLQ
jgi:hypothetical protein